MDNFDTKTLGESSKNNLLEYLYLLQSEFWEVNDFINTLKKYNPFVLDVRESTPIQNALNIAVVISYARNFKKSYGFEVAKKVNEELISTFTEEEYKWHNKILDYRDQEYAHSDSLPNDIQVYDGGHYSYSRRVVRQLLEKGELEKLQLMTSKIRDSIEIQLKYLVNSE